MKDLSDLIRLDNIEYLYYNQKKSDNFNKIIETFDNGRILILDEELLRILITGLLINLSIEQKIDVFNQFRQNVIYCLRMRHNESRFITHKAVVSESELFDRILLSDEIDNFTLIIRLFKYLNEKPVSKWDSSNMILILLTIFGMIDNKNYCGNIKHAELFDRLKFINNTIKITNRWPTSEIDELIKITNSLLYQDKKDKKFIIQIIYIFTLYVIINLCKKNNNPDLSKFSNSLIACLQIKQKTS